MILEKKKKNDYLTNTLTIIIIIQHTSRERKKWNKDKTKQKIEEKKKHINSA